MKTIPLYKFYRHKYGKELLVDVLSLDYIKKGIQRTPVHRESFYQIVLFTQGREEVAIDGCRRMVRPGEVACSRPGGVCLQQEMPSPAYLAYYLRGLGAQGILSAARAILVGKPCRNRYYEEYKPVYRKVLKEFGREDMPVLYNVNFGHCPPIGIIPYGVTCEADATQWTITLCESCVI